MSAIPDASPDPAGHPPGPTRPPDADDAPTNRGSTEDASVTVAVTHDVDPSRRPEFEGWLHGVSAVAQDRPGHLGSSVLLPMGSDPAWHVLYRFADDQAHRSWLNSPERADLLATADRYSDRHPQQQRFGLEGWFAIPGAPPATAPPRWKMALLTFGAIYPLSLAFQLLAGPHLVGLPVAVRTALLAGSLVTLLTWAVLPLLNRLLRPWLRPVSRTSPVPDRPGAAARPTRSHANPHKTTEGAR